MHDSHDALTSPSAEVEISHGIEMPLEEIELNEADEGLLSLPRPAAKDETAPDEPPWRSFFQMTGKSLLVIDLADEKIVEANTACSDLFGYSRQTLVGKVYSDLLTAYARPLFNKHKAQIAASNGDPVSVGSQVYAAGGKPFFIRAAAYLLAYQNQKYALLVIRPVLENSYKEVGDTTALNFVQSAGLLNQLQSSAPPQQSPVPLHFNWGNDNGLTFRSIEPVVDLVLDQLVRLGSYDSAVVFLIKQELFQPVVTYGENVRPQVATFHLLLSNMTATEKKLAAKEPFLIEDLMTDPEVQKAVKEWATEVGDFINFPFRSWIGVPLIIDSQVSGILSIGHCLPDHYKHSRLKFFFRSLSLINQARSQRFSRIQGMAVQDERERIARELHDSINQIFYAIQLGGNTLKALAQRGDTTQLVKQADDIVLMAETGLTELRVLLIEMRPEVLERAGLIGSLESLIGIVQRRFGLTVEAEFEAEPNLPLTVKEGLYRIVQEAFNNTVKHAQATHVWLTLEIESDRGWLKLTVRDNGKGFDPDGSFPGHLGLGNMHERTRKLGGRLKIESTPGQGTRIVVYIPLSKEIYPS